MQDYVYFYIPGIAMQFDINWILAERLQTHPDHFYDGVKIGAIFGTIPGAIWNGGRVEFGHIEDDYVDLLMGAHNATKIPYRWTWTNPTITEEELKDEYCNKITGYFENGVNEVLVNNDLMENYIRKNYPKYPIISSTTKRITDIDTLNQELEKDYKLVVLDYDFNNEWELLKQIKHPEKCEILVNPICTPKCPMRKEHYRIIGEIQKGKREPLNHYIEDCPAQDRFMSDVQNLPTFISKEDLWNKYVPMGFHHFKIEGRVTCPLKPIEWYLYYMVKPEYQDEERSWLHAAFETLLIKPNIPVSKSTPNS